MLKFLLCLFIAIPLYTYADEIPAGRGDNDKGQSGGKLDDLEKASDNGDSFMLYLIADMIIHSPEIFFGSSTTYSYSDYPYKNNAGIYEENNNKLWHFDADFSYLRESSSLNGVNLDLNFNPSRYWSIKGKYANFSENFNFQENNLSISQVFVQYNRVRRERFNLQWGVGYINMQGRESKGGFGLNSGFELFFYNPLSLDLNYTLAYVGDASYGEFESKLNLYKNRFNIFLGYKHISVANVSLNNFMLGIGVNY